MAMAIGYFIRSHAASFVMAVIRREALVSQVPVTLPRKRLGGGSPVPYTAAAPPRNPQLGHRQMVSLRSRAHGR